MDRNKLLQLFWGTHSSFYHNTIFETVRVFGGRDVTMYMDEQVLDDMDMAQLMGGEL